MTYAYICILGHHLNRSKRCATGAIHHPTSEVMGGDAAAVLPHCFSKQPLSLSFAET